MEWRVTSPRDAVITMLTPGPQHGPTGPIETSVDLAAFQREGAERAARIMAQRGGVLIADSVGLGKTFIALALIESAAREGKRVLVVCPASIRRMWRHELARIDVTVELLSHTTLALHPPGGNFDLVVADEAHAFRNPATRRHRALRGVCRAARVVLLTATPVNNSLADLYFLLRIWMADSGLRDVGVGSLRAALLSPQPRPTDLERIKNALIVRRTRAQVRAAASDRFRFPGRVETVAQPYELAVPVSDIARHINALGFTAYGLGRAGFSPELMRYALLKRMESSLAAVRSTLRRQIRFHEEFIAANARGLLLRPASFRSLYDVSEDSLQLVLEEVALPSARTHDVAGCREDLRVLLEWYDALRSVQDDKLEKLIALLRSRPPEARTIVFTEFRDTARYLWSALRPRFPTGLIDGSGAWIGAVKGSRRQVVERFAPLANGATRAHERESIRVLVATDVLAEGMNLQDADAVVSYDLPWNPVRLIQRAGRVDRIGSPHDVVRVYNFIPDREFDALLGLARTIRGKLENVRESVGLEGPVLEPDDVFPAIDDTPVLAMPLAVEPVDFIPIAMMPGASGREIMVGWRKGSALDVVRVVNGQMTCGDGNERLSAALLENAIAPVSACMLVKIQSLVAAGRFDRPLRSLSPTGPGARAARLLRRLVGELPLLHTNQDFLARVDGLLEGLCGPLDLDTEEALEALCRQPWPDAMRLCDSLEKVLRRAVNPATDPLPWTVSGVLIVD